jgi:hypothetical protein
MMFWQLAFDVHDPARMVAFWARALGYVPVPPAQPDTTWNALYRARLGDAAAFGNRLFDPEGVRPPIFFQEVPESKVGKNRLHLDLYPTGRDRALSLQQCMDIVETKVADLVEAGATVLSRNTYDEPGDQQYFVVMQDPEGNEFCVS